MQPIDYFNISFLISFNLIIHLKIINKIINKYKTEENFLQFLLERAFIEIGFSKLITVKRNGYKIYLFPTSMSQMCYRDKKNYRINEEKFFAKYLRKGDIVIDVGANIGMLSLKAASIVGHSGLIYAIEASPELTKYLKKNIKLNRFLNIKVLNTAIGNKKGNAFIAENSLDDTMSNIDIDNNGLEISMNTLDDIIPKNQHVNLLKVDVEGFELFVFQGAQGILKKTDCVFFEVWDDNFSKYDYDSRDLLNLLISLEFRIFRLADNNLIEVFIDYKPTICEDLIAINKLSYEKVLNRVTVNIN